MSRKAELCWLCERQVYEAEGQLEGVPDAVRRGRKLKCKECSSKGATLGCHVRNCRSSFHLPCARLCCVLQVGVCEHHCDIGIGYMHCMIGLHRIAEIALLQFDVCNCCQVDAMSVVRQWMNSWWEAAAML